MKIITWNINGWRSLMKSHQIKILINEYDPDIICLQEIKINNSILIDIDDNRYNVFQHQDTNCPGYSGTAIFYKKEMKQPIRIKKNKTEGRLICFEFDNFILYNVYTPNSGDKLKRLEYRTNYWDKTFSKLVSSNTKPVIICGDLNVARTKMDLKNPSSNTKNAGYTREERDNFEQLLKSNKLKDIWREQHPNVEEYTYWSYFRKSRERNIGWRLDYFLTNYNMKIVECKILKHIHGSDHAPVFLHFT